MIPSCLRLWSTHHHTSEMAKNMTQEILRPRKLAMWMYLSFGVASVCFLFFPSVPITQNAGTLGIALFHVFLMLGSVISVVGSVRKRYGIEGGGIPLIVSALLAYAAILLSSDTTVGARYGLAAILIGASLGLIGRMIEVLLLAKIAADLERRGD